MSSDIYIPLSTVLTNPGLFELKVDYNVDVETATEYATQKPVDWAYVADCLKPVLLCRFGHRDSWRYVEVFDVDKPGGAPEMHVSCGGAFLTWLMHWLESHNFKYDII